MRKGYNGKILQIDLTTGQFEEEQPDEEFYRQYVGNGIMGAYYLLKMTKPGIDPLGPENPLMFFSGAVNGYPLPGLSRFTVSAKSPVTGGIGEARSEGPFAVALKKTGYDGLILKGAAREPALLVIEDGRASLCPAKELWGKKIGETTDLLSERYPESHAAVIGPAGENLVRFANIVSDYCHQASRAGLGAVMGAKKLKAVVLRGGKLPETAYPEECRDLNRWYEQKMRSNVLSMWQHDQPGFGVWIHTHGVDASVCVNNYQTADCGYLGRFQPEAFAPYFRGNAECPGCPNDCIKRYCAQGADSRAGGLHQEAVGALGPNIGNTESQVVVQANCLCNEYGMDPNSLGYTISFAKECAQRGLLMADRDLSFSDRADTLALIRDIALRKGLGNLLAEGSAVAAKRLGGEASKYALTVKGNEMTPIEPRSQTNLALGFAVAAVGPRYEICEHDWDFDTRVGWSHTLDYCRTLGILKRVPMDYLGEEKVHNFKMLSTLWSAADGLGICLFSTAPTRVYSLEDMSGLVRKVTGWETSAYEVMRVGELRYHLYRIYNGREGIGAGEDRLPDRFFQEEIDFGMHRGKKLDRKKFEECIQCYYQMMGWDEEGRPRDAVYYDYGLEWLLKKEE